MCKLSAFFFSVILFFQQSNLFSNHNPSIDELKTLLIQEYFSNDEPILEFEPVIGGQSDALIYKVTTDKKTYVLRINPPDQTQTHFYEAASLKSAGDIGVSPKVYFNYQNGHMILMDYVAKDKNPLLEPTNLWISKVAEKLKTLHSIDPKEIILKTQDDRTPRIIDYLKRSKQLPENMLWVADTFFALQKTLETSHAHKVLVHGDLSPLNLLYTSSEVFFIDFSETHYGDPLYDLAYFSFFHDLSKDLESKLILDYQGYPCDEATSRHITLHKQKILASLALEYFCLGLYRNICKGEVIDKTCLIAPISSYLKAFKDPLYKYDAQFFYEISQSAMKELENNF